MYPSLNNCGKSQPDDLQIFRDSSIENPNKLYENVHFSSATRGAIVTTPYLAESAAAFARGGR